MNSEKAILAIVVGAIFVVLGFTIKQFYAAKGMYGAALGRPIAKWKGRLLFVAIGFVFCVVGIAYFLSPH